MRFLTVTERELRSAARQKATYRVRWITAAVFFGLLVWLLWAFHGFTSRGTAPGVFRAFAFLTLLYCGLLGTTRTADCISAERRDGTLGLLFLTNLNSAEIVAGKLCSGALASAYGFFAVFPMLALPMLMGGIPFGVFARTVVVLLTSILFSLAAGFLSSVLCKRQFVAVALALGLTLGLGIGSMVAAVAAASFARTRWLADWIGPFSPIYAMAAAEGGRVFGLNHFWLSVVAIAGVSVCWLALTTFLLARTWRDRPKNARLWRRFTAWQPSRRLFATHRDALRRRLLSYNPIFWLSGRDPISAPVFMVIAILLTLVTEFVTAPLFGRAMGTQRGALVLGHLFAWFWTGSAIHALVLYYAPMIASQRLAEDKETGALELILCTATTERVISRGLWLAFWRKMLFPGLLAILVYIFFLWQCLVMFTFEPPGQIPPGVTPSELFWHCLSELPVRGVVLSWELTFLLRSALLVFVLLILTWPTLGWVGRWMGLRLKHPGYAPLASLALLVVPPVLLFTFVCVIGDKLDFDNLPERRLLPVMMWLGFAIGVTHCLLLSLWAASRLRHHLRPIAMSRYQPLPLWRWRLPSLRTLRRVGLATAGATVLVAVLVSSFYGYHNRRSKAAWMAFQKTLSDRGESLDIARLLPQPVPDHMNFARSPVFLGLLSKTNREASSLLVRLQSSRMRPQNQDTVLFDWYSQELTPLEPYLANIAPNLTKGFDRTRNHHARILLKGLEPLGGTLRDVASATTRFPAFQTSTTRDVQVLLRQPREPTLALENLHQVFQVRACALLEVGSPAEAAEDVLTGLRLVQLARQLPDVSSVERVQGLLGRTLQPLWEGLKQRAWTEPQIAAMQQELACFNLIADYTNSIRRAVLANISVWRGIAENRNAAVLQRSGYANISRLRLQPYAWWFENCILLYTAGENSLKQVDAATGRIQNAANWADLNGLPLDSNSQNLLQQAWWRGSHPRVVAFAQTFLSQAIIACALERFRLLHGAYPDSLDQLVPTLLPSIPHDAVSGRPVIYRPTDNGSFVLRGVGQNATDDTKNPASDDWLWAYSTNTPSTKQ
jgi:ABC-type transport system involved in cytochrome c biogenesis permease component